MKFRLRNPSPVEEAARYVTLSELWQMPPSAQPFDTHRPELMFDGLAGQSTRVEIAAFKTSIALIAVAESRLPA
jgi:hypothetical protein